MKKLLFLILVFVAVLTACSSGYQKDVISKLENGYTAKVSYESDNKLVTQYITKSEGEYNSEIQFGNGKQPLTITGTAHIEYGGSKASVQQLVNNNLIYVDAIYFEDDIKEYINKLDDNGQYSDENIEVTNNEEKLIVKTNDLTYEVSWEN